MISYVKQKKLFIFLLSSVTSKLVSTTFTTFYIKISLIKGGYQSVRRWSSTCFPVFERLLLLPLLHSDRFITFISSDLGINITGCGSCCNSNAKADKLWVIDGKMLMMIENTRIVKIAYHVLAAESCLTHIYQHFQIIYGHIQHNT